MADEAGGAAGVEEGDEGRDEEAARLRELAASNGHGVAMFNMAHYATGPDAAVEQMRWYYKAATAPEHQIENRDRSGSVAELVRVVVSRSI